VKGNKYDQETNSDRDPEMLEEYDFSNGVRGKYAAVLRKAAMS